MGTWGGRDVFRGLLELAETFDFQILRLLSWGVMDVLIFRFLRLGRGCGFFDILNGLLISFAQV